MTDRRGFLQQGMALTALPLMSSASLAPRASNAPRMLTVGAPAAAGRIPEQIIFDRRFDAARRFAGQAQRLALPLYGICGDVTGLWYDDLYHRWRAGPGLIAGMTSVAALFCLERLAFRHDRRVIFRADHVLGPDGRVTHTLSGPPSVVQGACLPASQAQWPTRMAQLTAYAPAERGQIVHAQAVTAAGSTEEWIAPLVSWIIAPRVSG